MSTARTSRYSSVVPLPSHGPEFKIIGCGAIGRPTALLLAALFDEPHLHLVDPDTVEEENLGTQCWSPLDVGAPKVDALRRTLLDTNPGAVITASQSIAGPADFEPTSPDGIDLITILAVDDMDVRLMLMETARAASDLVVDTRMAAEVAVVWPVHDNQSYDLWKEHWFPQADASPLPCTGRSTNYSASLAATLAVASITQYLRVEEPRRYEFTISTGVCCDPTRTSPFQEAISP